MKKILLIGPLPEPTTGVSLANKVVAENLDKDEAYTISTINTSYDRFDENIGAFSISKALFFIKQNFLAYKIFGVNAVYLTPGQTFFGVIKYAFFILLSRVLNKEIIIHIHGNYLGTEYSLLKGIKKRLFKFLLSKSNKGVVLSESLKGNLSPFIQQDNIYVLYNFVEDYLFKEKSVPDKQEILIPKIIFLSNLMEEKGIFDLLDALRTLEDSGFNFEAKIAGNIDKSNQAKCKTYFTKLKKVSYVGVVKGGEKKSLLEWGNIFILPTYYKMEGQPISILEAMSTGNIVLTTKHAGIPDIFTDSKNGFYVEKRNPNDIANKIKQVAVNDDLSRDIIDQNLIFSEQKYRVSNFINNLKTIFEA
ncbi:glycosyltransferase family 4 protein [Winogradskyella sp. PE311]|uniref:glycosyltransferase family 4 protein n=1 Tax=Winogradskyella sp. PE311 TaxID=3366943 RepID=UPI00397F5A6E